MAHSLSLVSPAIVFSSKLVKIALPKNLSTQWEMAEVARHLRKQRLIEPI